MIRMLATTLAVMLAAPMAGPFHVTFPVEGLTPDNADAVRSALQKNLASLETVQGDSILMEITAIGDGKVTLLLNCRGGLTVAHLSRALEGTGCSIDPSRWLLTGRAAFVWDPGTGALEDDRKSLQAPLETFGACEILDAKSPDGAKTVRQAHLVFRQDMGRIEVSCADLLDTLRKAGVKHPVLMWYTQPVGGEWAMNCAARIAPGRK